MRTIAVIIMKFLVLDLEARFRWTLALVTAVVFAHVDRNATGRAVSMFGEGGLLLPTIFRQ